ncbi:MAG: hypothetical protein Q7U45_00105 [Burkholderiaceae bacterium]|nr:hypothetical protein [Burkholderiaceae bacterium]MDP3485609.1 hypothetical protein [Methanobacteriaceae archaeon]
MSKNSVSVKEIKDKFWSNIDRIDELEIGTPERRELLLENNKLLEQLG